MKSNDYNPLLPLPQSDMLAKIRLDVIQMLNQTLACTVDLQSQVKQACWNGRGPDFSLLHTLFATLATDFDGYVDLVAERIAALGRTVIGTIRMAILRARLPEYPDVIVEGHTHILALAERFAFYAAALRTTITLGVDMGDPESAAVYTHVSRGVDKWL